MYELTDVSKITANDITTALASAPVKPESGALVGQTKTDVLLFLKITNDGATGLLDKNGVAPKIRQAGARARDKDTAADKLFAEMLKTDGGELRLIAVPVVSKDGRSQARSTSIEQALDKAYLRLTPEERSRILYGRAADSTQTVQVAGIDVTAIVPGMIYVMATGGAVKSHPVMGKLYRAITVARK